MAYQERWIRGASTPGDRACADRYAVIRDVVAPFTRPITVWDLGANLGYFGCRLANEFGAVAIMVDQRPVLVDVCRENAIPTTIAITGKLSALDLRELAASEHADVVLALNVLHHFPDPVEALIAVCQIGETTIIETPGRGDTGSASYANSQRLLDLIESLDAEQIGAAPSHVTSGVQRPIYRIRVAKPCVERGYAYGARVRARGVYPARPHTIVSTLDAKRVTFDGQPARDWLPGLNLWNWLQFGGSYPDRATVQQRVRAVAGRLEGAHGDFKPWNLILQGQTVGVIDGGHRQSVDDAQGVRDTLAWIDRPELAYVH